MSAGRSDSGAACLVAPDSFKGTMSAEQVAAAMVEGVTEAGLPALRMPLADGGEGTTRVLGEALGGAFHTAEVADPLGRPIDAEYCLLPDGRAVVEVAAASGLTLTDRSERDPLKASTRGTGELISAAVDAGAGEVLLAAGGSATTDGGMGAVEALRDAGLADAPPRITVLCDVTTAWQDSPRIFAPQKGASAVQVAELETRLSELAQVMPRDPHGVAMTGAAGGLAGGLWAWVGAELAPGASKVLDLLGFDQALADARCVITGEGRLDASTGEGKLVAEVAGRSHEASIPCLAVVGESALDPAETEGLGLVGVREGGNPGEISASARQLVESLS